MKEISFEESKKVLVKTLASIDKCCRENNIKYSLSWGTLIGAIRHKGFIPWDDDMDLMMSRDNYNRFIECYKDPEYNLYIPREDNDYYHIMAKISHKDTAIFYNHTKKSPHGLWVSIFPYDNAPDEGNKLWEIKRSILAKMYFFRTFSWHSNAKIKSVIIMSVGAILRLFKSYTIYKWLENTLTKYNGQTTKEIAIWDPSYGYHVFTNFPSEIFANYIDSPFDGVTCMVIKEYDKFLRMYYGDYMQLPPVEKRVASHDFKAYYIND